MLASRYGLRPLPTFG